MQTFKSENPRNQCGPTDAMCDRAIQMLNKTSGKERTLSNTILNCQISNPVELNDIFILGQMYCGWYGSYEVEVVWWKFVHTGRNTKIEFWKFLFEQLSYKYRKLSLSICGFLCWKMNKPQPFTEIKLTSYHTYCSMIV